MLNSINLTLYEVFGYLLPGLVALLGFAVLIWTLFYAHLVLNLSSSPSQGFYILLLLAAYFCGHMMQSIGNSVFDKSYEQECLKAVSGEHIVQLEKHSYWRRVLILVGLSKSQPRCLPDNIVKCIKGKVGKALGTKMEDVHPSVLFAICDEWLVQSDKRGDR